MKISLGHTVTEHWPTVLNCISLPLSSVPNIVIMGKCAPKPTKKSQTVKTRLQPLGKGPIKRTPRHEFDHRDKADNIYDVESIIAERSVQVNGLRVEEWLIRWKGYSDSHDTWEPIENLAGLEDDIAQFRIDKANLQPLKLGKRRRRTPLNDTTPVTVAATPTSTSADTSFAAAVSNPSPEQDAASDDEEVPASILRPAMRGRRTAKVTSPHADLSCYRLVDSHPSPHLCLYIY